MKRDKAAGESVFTQFRTIFSSACEEIQQGWSERERLKRSGRAEGRHWSPPLVDTESLFPDGLYRTMETHVS